MENQENTGTKQSGSKENQISSNAPDTAQITNTEGKLV
jgi:hypothetical protein